MEITGKKLIFEAMKSQFKNLHLKSIIVEYDIITNYNMIYITTFNNDKAKSKLDRKEKRIIKSILINKIVKLIDEKNVVKVFIFMNFKNNDIKLFYKLENKKEIFELKTN